MIPQDHCFSLMKTTEMCDSFGLGAFSGCNYGVAKLLGIFPKDSSNFDAKEDAVVSLGLYFIKDSNREEERKSGNLKAESKIEEAKADRLVNDNQQVTPSKVEVIQGEEMIGSNPTFFIKEALVLKSKGRAYRPKYVMV